VLLRNYSLTHSGPSGVSWWIKAGLKVHWYCCECFDTVGWMTGRASGLKKTYSNYPSASVLGHKLLASEMVTWPVLLPSRDRWWNWGGISQPRLTWTWITSPWRKSRSCGVQFLHKFRLFTHNCNFSQILPWCAIFAQICDLAELNFSQSSLILQFVRRYLCFPAKVRIFCAGLALSWLLRKLGTIQLPA